MSKLDADGDGTISLQEFLAAFKWTVYCKSDCIHC